MQIPPVDPNPGPPGPIIDPAPGPMPSPGPLPDPVPPPPPKPQDPVRQPGVPPGREPFPGDETR
jgi:hypothetical protein